MKEASHKRPHAEYFYSYEMSRMSKSTQTGSRLVVAVGWRQNRWRVTDDGYGIFLWSTENILDLDGGVAQLREYTKNH